MHTFTLFLLKTVYCGNFVFFEGGRGGDAIFLWKMFTIKKDIYIMAIYTPLSDKIDFGTNLVFFSLFSASMPGARQKKTERHIFLW